MSREFVPPAVQIGETVLWSPGPGDAPSPAIVTGVGQRAVSLAVIAKDWKSMQPKDGVRHALDPDLKDVINIADGVWQACPTPPRSIDPRK